MGLGDVSGTLCSYLAGGPAHLGRAPPTLWRQKGGKQWCSLAPPTRDKPRSPQRAAVAPRLLCGVSPVCCTESGLMQSDRWLWCQRGAPRGGRRLHPRVVPAGSLCWRRRIGPRAGKAAVICGQPSPWTEVPPASGAHRRLQPVEFLPLPEACGFPSLLHSVVVCC